MVVPLMATNLTFPDDRTAPPAPKVVLLPADPPKPMNATAPLPKPSNGSKRITRRSLNQTPVHELTRHQLRAAITDGVLYAMLVVLVMIAVLVGLALPIVSALRSL